MLQGTMPNVPASLIWGGGCESSGPESATPSNSCSRIQSGISEHFWRWHNQIYSMEGGMRSIGQKMVMNFIDGEALHLVADFGSIEDILGIMEQSQRDNIQLYTIQ